MVNLSGVCVCIQTAADSRQTGGVFCSSGTDGERVGQSKTSRHSHEYTVQE